MDIASERNEGGGLSTRDGGAEVSTGLPLPPVVPSATGTADSWVRLSSTWVASVALGGENSATSA